MAPVERVKFVFDSKAMSRIIAIIAFVSLVIGIGASYGQYRLSNCLADYADQYNKVAVQRSQASQASTDAIDKFVRAVVDSTRAGTPAAKSAAFQQAYEDYLTSRAAADEQRKLNPLPEPPKERC